MAKTNTELTLLKRRQRRVRGRVTGTAARPRLRVNRSLNHIYAQIIDDKSGKTLAAVSSVGLKVSGGNIEGAKAVGKAIGDLAKERSIGAVCFDRGGRIYHGRIKALAEAAREAGLQF